MVIVDGLSLRHFVLLLILVRHLSLAFQLLLGQLFELDVLIIIYGLLFLLLVPFINDGLLLATFVLEPILMYLQ